MPIRHCVSAAVSLRRLALLGAFFALFAAPAVWAAPATVYAKADGTSIRSGAKATDPLLAKVGRGTALQVRGELGARYQIALPDGRSGYVSRLQVATVKPEASRGLLSGMGTSQIGASESESVASLRGLSPAARRLVQSGETTEEIVKWVELMERRSAEVTKPQVQQFLGEAGVGL